MRPDIKWRISSQGSKKLKSKSFLSVVMIFAALIFLGFVYLFSLYDQRITLKKFKETSPVSIALTDFHVPKPLAKVSDQPLFQTKIPSKDRKSIQTILQNFNLESPTFVLAQIAYHSQNHQQNDIFYASSEKFHEFLSQAFINDGSKEISPSNSLSSNELFNLNAKPFDNPEKLSLITLVVLKLGEDAALTEKAIKSLPKEITFGYLPYGDQIAPSIQSAVDTDHEVLMMIPMEPLDYPDSDPGAGTLLTGLDASQLQQRLRSHLQKSKQIIGITNFLGSRFAFSSPDVKILIDELKVEGLMILDANTSPRSLISDMAQEANLPCAQTIFQIDTDLSSEDIKSKLFLLEQQALKDGKAIGYAFINDLTLETIISWSKTLSQRGIALAPLTYLVRK